MSKSFNPEDIPDAFKAAMILYQQANPTTSTGQPTVVQGIMNALNPQQQQQDPQQQMGAQPQSMGDVVGQAENAVPTQQQNAQMAAAQQMQGAAQGMPPGAGQQQMQQPDAGIVGLPASNTQQFKEGGVIGFAVGGATGLSQEERDLLAIKQGGRNALETLKSLAAAGYDMTTLLPRGVMGAAETAITRPLRAVGVPIPYLPESAYGGDRSSMTPMMDMLRRRREQEETPDHAMMSQALSGSGPTAKEDEKLPEVPQGDDSMAKLLAAIGVSGGGGGGMPDIDALTAQAEKTRDRLVQRPDTSPLDAIERMVNKHYAERPDIEGDALRGTEEDYVKEKEGRGMNAFLTRAAMMGERGSSGLLAAHFAIKKQVAEADDLYRKEVTLQRLAQQAIKDRNLGDLVEIKKALQEINDAQAKMRSEGGINLLGGLLTSDTNSRNRAAAAANARMNASSRLMAATLRGKTPTGMGIGDIEKLNNMVQGAFKNPNSPVFREYMGRFKNGAQVLTDLDKGTRTADHPEIAPLIAKAMNAYRNDIIQSSKHAGQQQVTSIGDYLSRADEEDADDTIEE